MQIKKMDVDPVECAYCRMSIEQNNICLVINESVHSDCYQHEMAKFNMELNDQRIHFASLDRTILFDIGLEMDFVDPSFEWIEENQSEMEDMRNTFAACWMEHLFEFMGSEQQLSDHPLYTFTGRFHSYIFIRFFDFEIFEKHNEKFMNKVRVQNWKDDIELERVWNEIVQGTIVDPDIRYIFEDTLHFISVAVLKMRIEDEIIRIHRTRIQESDENVFLKFPIQRIVLTCSICLQNFEDRDEVIQLPCGHVFHADELIQWGEVQNSCPCCRRNEWE